MKKTIFGDLLDRLSTINAKSSDSHQVKLQTQELVLAAKEEILKAREEIESNFQEVEELKEKELVALKKAAGLSKEEAEEKVIKQLEGRLVKEMALRIKEAEDKAE